MTSFIFSGLTSFEESKSARVTHIIELNVKPFDRFVLFVGEYGAGGTGAGAGRVIAAIDGGAALGRECAGGAKWRAIDGRCGKILSLGEGCLICS